MKTRNVGSESRLPQASPVDRVRKERWRKLDQISCVVPLVLWEWEQLKKDILLCQAWRMKERDLFSALRWKAELEAELGAS